LPQARDFLDRFRPAGAPGAMAGVPTDRTAERSAELRPVLELLAETHAECGRIVAAARQHADQTADSARQQAAALATDARDRARAAREAALDQQLSAARAEASAAVSAAGARASRLRTAVTESQADHLAALAVELLCSLSGPGGQR